jgi:hypothetical protein
MDFMTDSVTQYLGIFAATLFVGMLAYFVRSNFQNRQQQVFKCYANLIADIFSCLLTPAYSSNLYLFERRIHKQKLKCLRALNRLNLRQPIEGKSLLLLFELILDVSQIRWRVTDHTIFGLCDKELQALEASFIQLFSTPRLAQTVEVKLAATASSIDQFESIYMHAMNVTAKEPTVFILFISAMRSIQKHFSGMVA